MTKPMYEFKHITTFPETVQDTIDRHGTFFWEVIGTDTSATSHTEGGKLTDVLGDIAFNKATGGIFNRRTTHNVVEKWTNINFRRDTSIPNLPAIRAAEREYFAAIARVMKLADETPEWTGRRIAIAIVGFIFYVVPGVCYVLYISNKIGHKKAELQTLAKKCGEILDANATVLNLPDGHPAAEKGDRDI